MNNFRLRNCGKESNNSGQNFFFTCNLLWYGNKGIAIAD